MRQIECGIVKDLLPLYMDEACSDASKRLIQSHLADCKDCSSLLQTYANDFQFEEEFEPSSDALEIKMEYRRLKRWKRRGYVLCAIIVCVAILFVTLGIHQYQKEGICFTNIKILYQTNQFAKALENGEYEKAYKHFDIKTDYNDMIAIDYEDAIINQNIRTIEANGYDWYNQICHDAFVEKAVELETTNHNIVTLDRRYIVGNGNTWQIEYHGELANGETIVLTIDASKSGIVPRSLDGLSPTFNEAILNLIYEGTDVDWKTPLGNENFMYKR